MASRFFFGGNQVYNKICTILGVLNELKTLLYFILCRIHSSFLFYPRRLGD